ncbi:hypothetical protein ABEB36_002117 [Hypothenemus hampei]|uniref:Uncharacterized protein n=1 Tax=Hypothenemus hampei TaxID=57062 RepID=A0ABD1F588_HYPHA
MDEFVTDIVNILTSTVAVRVTSNPNFAVEILVAFLVCVVHCLLIFDVNTLARRANAKATTKLRINRSLIGSKTCSFHSLVTMRTMQIFDKKPEFCQKTQIVPPDFVKEQRKLSRNTNSGWALSRGDSNIRHKFSDRVEHLLSISPSEYVRRDKERKHREQGLKSCIQSLTSLLEKALSNECMNVVSKEDVKKSLNEMLKAFNTRITPDNIRLSDFPVASLQSLIERNSTKLLLQSSLSPDQLSSSIYRFSNVSLCRSAYDLRLKKKSDNIENKSVSKENLSVRTNESLNEIFRKKSLEFFGIEEEGLEAN